MKKIDRYILKNFSYSFFVSFMAFVVIFNIPSLIKTVDYITEGTIKASQGLELFLVGIPKTVIDIIPLSVVFGGLITSNKMSTKLELMALKTSGVSFSRIILYPVILSFIISLAAFWFIDSVVPKANERRRELRYTEVYNVKDSRIKTDVYYKGEKNIYYISFINGSEKTVKNIMVLVMNDEFSKIEKIITAQNGEFNEEIGRWDLRKVKINNIVENKMENYMNYTPDFLNENPNDFLRDKIRENELTRKDLMEAVNVIGRTGGDARKIRVALYERLSYPFAAFIISFIGLSLGSRYVRGTSAVSIALCIVIGYLYYIVKATVEAISIGGKISPFLGSWIPNIIFLVIGIYTMKQSEY